MQPWAWNFIGVCIGIGILMISGSMAAFISHLANCTTEKAEDDEDD